MKQVYQKDENGCWIACVSMLTGVDYDAIKGRFNFRDEVTGRAAGPIVKLLAEFGYECAQESTKLSKIGHLSNLDHNALVYAKNLDSKGSETSGHWLVWDANLKVLRDPEGWHADRPRIIKNFRIVKPKRGKSV